MRIILSILTLLIFVSSCADNEGNNQIVNHLNSERIILLRSKLEHISRFGNDLSESNNKFQNHLSQLFKMFRKIEGANSSNSLVDFSSDYNYFKKDSLIDLKFWKDNENLSIDKAILNLDHLLFEFQKSNYCNDWFKFSGVTVGFKNTKEFYSQNTSDSVRFLFEGNSGDFIPQYYFNNEKNNIVSTGYLNLDLSKKGVNTIKGFVTVRKMNRYENIPFNYSYIVK